MPKGKIIFLNGISSAGKSTLAKKLQERLVEPYYHLSVDRFFDIGPQKYMDSNPHQTVSIALTAMNHTIKTYVDIGINVIVDTVLLKNDAKEYTITGLDTLDECVALLHEYEVLFVLVSCPADEIRRREKERGRAELMLENQLPLLNPQNTYDITVDTTNEKCVDEILYALNCPENFKAFNTLWSQRVK